MIWLWTTFSCWLKLIFLPRRLKLLTEAMCWCQLTFLNLKRMPQNIHLMKLGSLNWFLFCLEEIWSTPIIFVSPTFARVAHTMILILFLSFEIGFLSCDSWTSLFIRGIVHLIQLTISQKYNIFISIYKLPN